MADTETTDADRFTEALAMEAMPWRLGFDNGLSIAHTTTAGVWNTLSSLIGDGSGWNAVTFLAGRMDLPARVLRPPPESWGQPALHIVFEDRSSIMWPAPDRPAVDDGESLLEPITVVELRGVEAALTVIERAIDAVTLTETQEQRVRGMLAVIENQRRQSEPEVTERWKLVGAFWAAATFLAIEFPQGVGSWPEAVAVLQSIGWPHVAGILA